MKTIEITINEESWGSETEEFSTTLRGEDYASLLEALLATDRFLTDRMNKEREASAEREEKAAAEKQERRQRKADQLSEQMVQIAKSLEELREGKDVDEKVKNDKSEYVSFTPPPTFFQEFVASPLNFRYPFSGGFSGKF